MKLDFKTETLRKKCKNWLFFWKKNNHMNKALTKRLRELDSVPNLLDIKNRKSLYHLHPLIWDRKYQLSIDIDWRKNVFRIIFETDPKELVCDDFMNDEPFELVTKIKIIEITDKTH